MEVYVISQMRKDGTFPGLHKVACPSLTEAVPRGCPSWSGYLLEVFEDREQAKEALQYLIDKIGPFYTITTLTLEIGERL